MTPILDIGTNRFTVVTHSDIENGEAREYFISPIEKDDNVIDGEYGYVRFQKGGIAEHSLNGCFIEDLLAITIHRLSLYQSGDLACRENAIAIIKIQEAMSWLNARTVERQRRGVEGTKQP